MKKALYLIICIALGVAGCTTESDRMRMRAGLDSINVRNRNGLPFTVSEVQPYADFFDEHGTPNDRLLAHYLLGLAYSDHGEAPMALQCYQDAIDCADTLSADCDYAQLARVYGQMAEVFYYQGVYKQNIDFQRKAVKYAWLGKDTLAGLMYYEQISFAYIQLKDTLSAMEVIEEVAKKYNELGYPSDAVITLGGNIRLLIDMGDYDKAKDYINMYEAESGRFDSCGNIEAGREIYYKSKGLYYLYTNKWDSAEYYFRKEMRDGKDYNNQNAAARGLSELYQRLLRLDSVAKYSLYAYAMSDSLYSQRTAKEVERIQAMYDYTRHQEVAHKESQKAIQANIRFLISAVVLLIVLLIASWLYIARKKLIESLGLTIIELNKIKTENKALKQDASANLWQISENEKRISYLEKKMGRYGKLVFFGDKKMENDLKLSPNYQQIQAFAYKGLKLSMKEWNFIRNLISEYFPGFYDFLLSHLQIDSTEYRICLLLRLHFKAGEIANMLGVTPPYISKISTEILENLFGKKGSSKELSKELGKIN